MGKRKAHRLKSNLIWIRTLLAFLEPWHLKVNKHDI